MNDLRFRRLVGEHIPSVWVLELLLVMRASAPRAWTPNDLVQELRASDLVVLGGLERLVRSGLVAVTHSHYVYAPATVLLADFVAKLAVVHQTRPVKLINLIAAADPSGSPVAKT